MVQADQANESVAADEDLSPLAELGVAPARRRLLRKLLRVAGVAVLVAYFGFAAAVLALRFWILPRIEEQPQAVAEIISRNIGQRVSIGSIDSGWQRLRPYLDMTDVRLYDQDGRVALTLPSVSCTLAWDSLAFGSLHFFSLSLEKPDLNIRRDEGGTLYIAGVKLDPAAAGGGFSNWLLGQREIIVRDARVHWDDQLRKARTLSLADVNFVMRNSGIHHRFALRAQPERELAAALDLRGDIEGRTFEQLQAWNGKLYAELGYANLAAWRTWVDYPLEIERGQGGLRLWLGFADKRLQNATADVALGDVSARLAPDLPLLEMRSLQGRLAAKHTREGYEIAGKQVALALQSGLSLPPAQFALQWRPGAGGQDEQGDLRVDALELAPLAQLAEYLPLPASVRQVLADAAPEGSVSDVHFDWQGKLAELAHFSIRGHFERLGMRAYEWLPGFSGISGNIDGNEKGGSVLLNAAKSSVDLPRVFADSARGFDTLTAQLAWTRARGELQFRLSNIAFANADLAGTAYGSYTTAGAGPGVIDLTARLNRTDVRRVARYIPFVDQDVISWLDQALVGGHATEVSLRLKGDLKDFPFRNPKAGLFQIAAKVVDGRLQYAPGWPAIEGIQAEFHLDGKRMDIVSSKANVLGARVTNAHAVLPDLFAHDRVLAVNGSAEGPTAAFLKFVAQSPVNEMIGGATAGMSASGNGKLQLKLELPLAHLAAAKVGGSYQFAGNQLNIDPELPPLTQAGGRLEFTDSGVAMRSLGGQFLGGPVAASFASQRDGSVAVSARGSMNVSALQTLYGLPLLKQLSGSASWSSSMSFRKRGASIVIESGLQGVASNLPAPLGKTAGEALPLRLERTVATAEQRSGWIGLPAADRTTVDIGKSVHIEVQRRREDGKLAIERAAIGINEPPRLPERGFVISGSAPALDLDQWLHALGGAGTPGNLLTTLNIKVGALDVYGKRLNAVSLHAGFQGGDWLANIDAKELAGDVRWRGTGKGRMSAHFSHFTFPEPTPGKQAEDVPPKDLPGLDIVADNLVVHDKKLGRLELTAANEGLDWHIDKLALVTPDSQLTADGVWQGVAAQQRTSLNLKLEVKDVGKFLDRLGYPGSMQRGTAKLLGKLSWAGNPQSIDYPTLSGDLSLIAEKGQFLKIEPGIGKLLGILSLQALPRRITLDFRDIFSEGFAFDTITATASVAKGILHTQDFSMSGPSARVAMSGSVDLTHETQALKVRVVPSVGDSLSVAGLVLANPLAGVGAFLAQRVLKDPLGQAFAYEYSVTGTWTDPKVEKVPHELPGNTAGDNK